jgi:hypothetical protein
MHQRRGGVSRQLLRWGRLERARQVSRTTRTGDARVNQMEPRRFSAHSPSESRPASNPVLDSSGGSRGSASIRSHLRRGWRKLHLGVDGSGVIVAEVLTDGHADDAAQMGELLDAVEGDITSVVADAAYDTAAVYDAASARGAKVIVPPTRTAVVSRRRPRSDARDRTIKRVAEIGRRR